MRETHPSEDQDDPEWGEVKQRSLKGALNLALGVKEGFLEEEVNKLRFEGQGGMFQVKSDQWLCRKKPGELRESAKTVNIKTQAKP